MNAPRTSLAFGVGRDLLFAVLACAAAVLVSLTVQLEMTKQALRERSLDGAAQYIARHLQREPDGEVRLAIPPDSWRAAVGYPAVVFDRDGRIVFERPAGLDPALRDVLSQQRLADADLRRSVDTARFFTVAREIGRASCRERVYVLV